MLQRAAVERLGTIIVSVVFFLPEGLFLQWWLPRDGPYEVPTLGAAAVLIPTFLMKRSQFRFLRSVGQGVFVIVRLVCRELIPAIEARVLNPRPTYEFSLHRESGTHSHHVWPSPLRRCRLLQRPQLRFRACEDVPHLL